MAIALLRKREIWVPTLSGWAALLGACALCALLAARAVYPFLAVSDPVGAPIAVVEGWLEPEELDEAIAALRARKYRVVLTTGGPLQPWPDKTPGATFAHRAAAYLKQRGLADIPVVPVPSPHTLQDRTFTSASMVREWATRSGARGEKIDVFSRGPHARRSRMLYERVLGPDVPVGVVALAPHQYAGAAWWRNSTGARDVAEQATGLLWTVLFFKPGPL